MATVLPALSVSPAKDPLPAATPQLMPFHIGYSGPAPVSTYFCVRSAPEPTFGRETKLSETKTPSFESQTSMQDSQSTLVGDSQPTSSSDTSAAASSSSATLADVDMQGVPSASSQTSPRHFTAAFRGRLMHGLKVGLPEGYAGVVLRAPDDLGGKNAASRSRAAEEQESKARARSKATAKNARRSRRVEDVEEDVEESESAGADQAQVEGPVRTLIPEAQFSSFVLWHPDIPVDEGRDEYLRSLTEWTSLSAEIHRVEDC
ncbi:ribonuclease H2, subunit C [Trametes maxima]|nr:ribonuclease H2, subunit C [Trametes maxima]